MPYSELAVVVVPQTFSAPILIERAGPSTRKKFFEFFTVPIRNAHCCVVNLCPSKRGNFNSGNFLS